MATIQPGFGQISSNLGIRSGPPPIARKEVAEQPVRNDDNLVSINFTPPTAPHGDATPVTVAQVPADNSPKVPAESPAPPPPPTGTSYGTGGTLLMTDEPAKHSESSSIDGFLARLAGSANKGMESSGTVLKRAMVDAADFGNRVGKMLGCDETAPGLKGFAGTTLSLGATMVGGLVAMPLALVVGVADAVS